MAARAAAILNITIDAFYDMTPKQFYYMLQARRDWEEQRVKHEMQVAYEVERLGCVMVINSQLKRKDQYKDVQDLIRFTWEGAEPKKQSVSEMKEILLGIASSSKKRKTRMDSLKKGPPKKLMKREQNDKK